MSSIARFPIRRITSRYVLAFGFSTTTMESISTAPWIPARRLLNSWATPPASMPTVVRRWFSRRMLSVRTRSETSRVTRSTRSLSPVSPRAGVAEDSTSTNEPSARRIRKQRTTPRPPSATRRVSATTFPASSGWRNDSTCVPAIAPGWIPSREREAGFA